MATDIAGSRTAAERTTTARAIQANETKHSSKTTEFYAMVGVIVGILIAAWYVGRDDAVDAFGADRAWLYVSIVASAYIVSRGLAKSGSRQPVAHDDDTSSVHSASTSRTERDAARV